MLAWVLEAGRRRGGGPLILAPIGLLWLLFFPNASYIVTDFVHLRAAASAPLWYDVVLIAPFAFAGMKSWDSLRSAASSSSWRIRPVRLSVGTLLQLLWCWRRSACPIGRFEVRNSWDVIVHPVPLARDTWHQLGRPSAYPRAFGVTSIVVRVRPSDPGR